MPEISIVIPTLDRPQQLERTLAGLEPACAGIDAEVLIVTDATDPNPSRAEASLAERDLEGRCLSGSRPGASAARNSGWRSARSPLILFLGDDVVPAGELVVEHLLAHDDHPEDKVGILGQVRWAPELKVTPLMRWLEHGVQFDYPNIIGTDAGWGRFYTANVSLKRAALERVDGFDDETFPFLYEDLDLGYRLHRELDFELIYERRALGNHLHATNLEEWRRRVRSIAVAERTFCRVHPEVEPHFHRLFSSAAARPPARGRGRHLIGLIPRGVPILGNYAWNSADLYFAQALAPEFLDAWEQDGDGEPGLAGRGGGSAGREESPA